MKYLEKIENYLNDNLSKNDRLDFETECQTNEVLANELAFYLQTKEAFKTQKQTQFKQRYKTKETTNEPTIRRITWIAAIAAAVVLLLWFGFPLFNDYQNKQQLAKIETPAFFLNNQITRSNDSLTNVQKLWQDAFFATKNKNYEQAIVFTNRLKTKEAIGLKAFCYFELKDYENAASAYEQYLQQNPEYYERLRSQWNLALTYRFLGKTEKEEEILKQIGQEGRKELLEVLEH